MLPQSLADISHVIQLAIAPVFLLTAIGTILNVLAGRLWILVPLWVATAPYVFYRLRQLPCRFL